MKNLNMQMLQQKIKFRGKKLLLEVKPKVIFFGRNGLP